VAVLLYLSPIDISQDLSAGKNSSRVHQNCVQAKMASSCLDKVFSIPELFETELLQFSLRDLLHAQRVYHTLKNIIEDSVLQ
jgi:hypothetical protein